MWHQPNCYQETKTAYFTNNRYANAPSYQDIKTLIGNTKLAYPAQYTAVIATDKGYTAYRMKNYGQELGEHATIENHLQTDFVKEERTNGFILTNDYLEIEFNYWKEKKEIARHRISKTLR